MEEKDSDLENIEGIKEISDKDSPNVEEISELEFDTLLLNGITIYEDSVDKYWTALQDLKGKALGLAELYLRKQRAKQGNLLKYTKDENNIIEFEIIRPIGEPNFIKKIFNQEKYGPSEIS